MSFVNFARQFVGRFEPADAPAPESESLLYHAGKITGPTIMRPDPSRLPVGTEFYDTTTRQIVRAAGATWRDQQNRAV
jgi:hypothetical protein